MTSWAAPSLGQLENFLDTILKAKDCIEKNFVLPRGDGIYDHDSQGSKPWSVNWYTYCGSHSEAMARCTNIEDLLGSLKAGVRVSHVSTLSDVKVENATESWFVPKGCSFRWYTSHDVCNVMGRYSQLYVVGDSLMRHLHHGLFMLLRNDLQSGAMPLQLNDVTEYDKRLCDGQFFEHGLCRNGLESSVTMRDPRQFGICTGSSYRRFSLFRRESAPIPRLSFDVSACAELSRPVFILLGGGAHHKHDAHDTIHDIIEPFLSEVRDARLACPNVSFHVAFLGLGSQSRSQDLKYPHQSREMTAIFNDEVSGYLKERHGIRYFDVQSLTRNAPTSDGYHILSDVNLILAMYVLNYMDLLAV